MAALRCGTSGPCPRALPFLPWSLAFHLYSCCRRDTLLLLPLRQASFRAVAVDHGVLQSKLQGLVAPPTPPTTTWRCGRLCAPGGLSVEWAGAPTPGACETQGRACCPCSGSIKTKERRTWFTVMNVISKGLGLLRQQQILTVCTLSAQRTLRTFPGDLDC